MKELGKILTLGVVSALLIWIWIVDLDPDPSISLGLVIIVPLVFAINLVIAGALFLMRKKQYMRYFLINAIISSFLVVWLFGLGVKRHVDRETDEMEYTVEEVSTSFSDTSIPNSLIEDILLGGELTETDQSEKYAEFDFSDVWLTANDDRVYGIIGKEHQRIHIKFLTIEKDQNDGLQYNVAGKSMVKNNICDFSGTIRISQIQEVKELHFGVDRIYADSGIIAQGVVFATYEFREDSTQNYSGYFSGELISKWYLDQMDQIRYDDIQSMADGYMNNAFIGNWTSYSTRKSKACNWANHRVPLANEDFDIGAGEISVAERYWDMGWADLRDLGNPNHVVKKLEWWQ